MTMRQFLTSIAVAGAALTALPAMAQTVQLSGAGASFAAPLLQRWFQAYNAEVDSNVEISYQSIGSGAGLEQVIAGTVDFGASEAPFEGDRLESFRSEYGYEPLQVPMMGGYISFSYNLPGLEDLDLQLSREAYCGIITGEITDWQDDTIVALNPDVDMPDLPITWAHRSDGSGTTFVFSNHIESACPNWEGGVGTSVEWPVGIGGQGNEGVAATIQQEPGAIGYLSYAYAFLNDIDSAMIENNAGTYVAPTVEGAQEALLSAEVPEDFGLLVPDPTGETAYPIVGLAWVMLYRNYSDAAKWEELRSVIDWALTSERGIELAEELVYLPIPAALAERIAEELDTVTTN